MCVCAFDLRDCSQMWKTWADPPAELERQIDRERLRETERERDQEKERERNDTTCSPQL